MEQKAEGGIFGTFPSGLTFELGLLLLGWNLPCRFAWFFGLETHAGMTLPASLRLQLADGQS